MSKDNEKEIKEKKKNNQEEKKIEKKSTVKEEKNNTKKEDSKKKSVKKVVHKKIKKRDSSNENIEVVTKDSELHEKFQVLGSYLLGKLKEYRYVFLLDIIVFLLLFFLIPKVIFEVSAVVWMTAFVVFTVLPTIGIYGMNKFRDKQILFSFFFIYLLILLFLSKFTIIELYGITSQGTLDHTPAWLDAVFVTCIIVFFQYIGILIVNVFKTFGGNNKKVKK